MAFRTLFVLLAGSIVCLAAGCAGDVAAPIVDVPGAAAPSDSAWDRVRLPTEVDLFAVDTAGDHVWVVGAEGTILHSPDRGESWERQGSGTDAVLTCVDFRGGRVGVVGGGGILREKWDSGERGRSVILRTTDAGTTWEAVGSTGNFGLWGISCTGPETVFVVSSLGRHHADGHLHRWYGGRTWNFTRQPDGRWMRPTRCLFDIDFADAEHGWAVGFRGGRIVIAGSSDRVHYLDEPGSLIRTTDGGSLWVAVDVGNPDEVYLFGVDFRNPSEGWTVGERGSIYRSVNGGGGWSPQASGTEATLLAVRAGPDGAAWAVGEGGTLLETADDGETWSQVAAPAVDGVLRGLAVADDGVVWAVGDGGLLLRR